MDVRGGGGHIGMPRKAHRGSCLGPNPNLGDIGCLRGHNSLILRPNRNCPVASERGDKMDC